MINFSKNLVSKGLLIGCSLLSYSVTQLEIAGE